MNLLTQAVDSCPTGFLVINSRGLIVETNLATATLFGYEKEDLIGSEVERLIPSMLYKKHKEHIKNFFKKPNFRKLGEGKVLKGITKFGNELSLEIGVNYFEENGESFGVANIVDISKEVRFKGLLDRTQQMAKIGSWQVDLGSMECTWSNETYRIHELDPSVVVKVEDGINFYAEEHRSIIQNCVEEGISQGKSWDQKLQIVTTKGRRVWVRAVGSPVISEGRVVGLEGTFQDIDIEVREQKLADTISEIRKNYISLKDEPNKFFDFVLQNLIDFTESEYGFIGKIITGENGEPYLKTFSITDISWNEETRQFYRKGAPEGLEFFNLNTLFGEVIKSGSPLITNFAAGHPKAAGIPNGHPSLDKFMGIPIWFNKKLIAMVGLANRTLGYSDEFFSSLSPLINTLAFLINDFLMSIEFEEARLEREFVFETLSIGSWVYHFDNGKFTWNLPEVEFKQLTHKIEKDTRFTTYLNEQKKSTNELEYLFDEYKDSPYTLKTKFRIITDPITRKKKSIGALWDHTDESMLQKELIKQKDKAEELSKAKSLFLANMSHEIRTPLNAIIGLSELISETRLDHIQDDYVRNLKGSGEILLGLVNDILDLSKIESGQMTINRHAVNVSQLLNIVESSMHYAAKSRGNTLHVTIKFESDKCYQLDSVRIRQVLINFIGNANKFTENGSIEVVASANKRDGHELLKVEVIDTGIGVSPEVKDKIFESFSQADASTERKFGGTGLGLTISKKIVVAMNGKIGVESDGKSGSNFWFEIPVEKSDETILVDETPPLDESQVSIKGMKVLVAEDNLVNQKVVIGILSKFSVIVETAENGKVAIERLKDFDADLVLMDCQMPVMDGFETVRRLRKNPKYSNLPIVALTANALEEDRQKCLEVGMDDFLTKPFKKKDVFQVLAKFYKSIPK